MNSFDYELQNEFLEKNTLLNNKKGERISDSKEFIILSSKQYFLKIFRARVSSSTIITFNFI